MLNVAAHQREAAEILQRLKDKQYGNGQQRMNAIKTLKSIITNCNTTIQFTDDWQGFFGDLFIIFNGKVSVENKRSLGEIASQMITLLPGEYEWILDWIKQSYNKIPTKYEEERAIFVNLMTTCLEQLLDHNIRYRDEPILDTLDFIVEHLENINRVTYINLLEALLKAVTLFSVRYQHIFQQRFEIIATTVFSWSVEQTSSKLQNLCRELTRSFLPFWESYRDLGYKLVTEYISEIQPNVYMESYDRDALSRNRSIIFAVATLLETLLELSLTEFSHWVLEQVTEIHTIAEGSFENLSNYACQDVAQFLSSFTQIYAKIFCLRIFDIAKPVIWATLEQTIKLAEILAYNQTATIEILEFFTKLYQYPDIPYQWHSQLAYAILGLDGILLQIIAANSRKVIFLALKNLISSMVIPISVQQLQETFFLVKQTMSESAKTLLDSLTTKRVNADLVNNAKTILILFAKALERFATIKNSLVIIMGMQPSLLHMLCLELPVCHSDFGSRFPSVQYALLKLIIGNCESHDYYLATSEWLAGNKPNQMGESVSSKHAQLQLQTISKCLQNGIKWKYNRELVCTWLANIISRIDDTLLVKLAKRREWMELHRAVITGLLEDDIEESLHEVARRLGVLSNEYEKNIAQIISTISEKVATIDPERGRAVHAGIDSSLFIRASVSHSAWDNLEYRQPRVLPSDFTNTDFALLADFLLKGKVPSFSLNPEDDSLWLFDTINAIYNNQNEKTAPKDVSKYMQKWRWALAQMAVHCVENKMKTSLGKATDTFNAIGAEVQRLGKVALKIADDRKPQHRRQEMKSPRRVQKDEDQVDDDYGLDRELTDAEEWWRIRCLLEFVEIFDKMVFNAITGAHYPLANVSQLARQFFHANLTNCNEWLSRTYPFAMLVAFHCGYYAQVIRFGSSALVDLEKRQQKAEQFAKEKESSVPVPTSNALAIIILIGRAMAELGTAQAAKGLQIWTAKLYKIDVDWLSGAVEMASARYESALKYLIQSLHKDDLSDTLKVHLRAMIFDILNRLRLPILLDPMECPQELSIWTEAEKLSPYPAGFDEEALSKLTNLCTFAKVDNVAPTTMRWDINELLFSTETLLMQTLRRTEVLEMKDHLSQLGHLAFITDSGQRVHGRVATVEKILTALAAKMNKKFQESDSIAIELDSSFLGHSDSDIGERLNHARKLCFWSERLEANKASYEQPAILARKTGNYLLAEELLKKLDYSSRPTPGKLLALSLERAKILWNNGDLISRGSAWSQTFAAMDQALVIENMRQQHLTYVANNPLINGAGSTMLPNGRLVNVASTFSHFPVENYSEQISKAAMKLARWLREENELLNNLTPELYPCHLWGQMDAAVRDFGGDYLKFLLSLSVQMSPNMAKAHLNLGDWFYNSAKKDFTTDGKDNFVNRYKAFMGSVSEEAFDKLWDLLFTARSITELNESINSLVDPSTASFFLGSGSKYIESWTHHHQNRISLLTGAVNAYFAYISQLGSKQEHSMGTVSATLRILGLLIEHPEVLSSVVPRGFSQTNELLWKDILPQLFSRLSHPNRFVREAIVSLISKICISAPHSVVFQVVSGASSFSFMEEDDDVIESEDAEEQENSKKEKTLMFECCQQLKGILQEINPSLVADVQLFTNELQKISLLNEEKWTFVLSNLDHEMGKRLEQIRKEMERTTNAAHLDLVEKSEIIAEKSQLITSTVYRILQDLYDRTCVQKPATLNEELFVEEFGPELKRAFELSKNAAKNPEKAWSPFRQFLSLLQQKNARRGAQVLNIQDISVVLAKLNGTSIPLPGQENCDYGDVVTLTRVGATAQILPTKTRPKKMMFVGSDGKEQIFLFKGQEDLHLDERIMQVLQICNLLLSRSSKRSWPNYTARHYAVTPLGPRSGLIQWVGGATPLFFLYRKWQQRQVQIQHSLEKKNGTLSAVPDVERPTDLYQKILRAAFLKHKVEPEIISDRSRWPQNVLKEVLHNLLRETPKDLVSRELWMKAGSSDTWWRVICRMARSTAVMSMIGAVLGLGDRHLDNLLVNLDRGEIVHIDYNICFDKGKTLRVPETVPFRLTQNLVHAMGPTQTEGVFRESCCHVLENLRTNQEILLTILEAFIYDPLVDWTSTDHLNTTSAAVSVAVALAVYGNDSRIQDAKPIARKMFSVRRREYSVPWIKNYGDIVTVLDSLKTTLQKIINGGTAWDNPAALDQKKTEGKRKLQQVLTEEQHMMKHFRPLMKTLATCDDRFTTYLKNYKEGFHQPVMKVFHLLESQDTDELKQCLEKLQIVQQNVYQIYHDILDTDTKENSLVANSKKTETNGFSPPPGLEDRLVRNEQQEQNAYAQNAVKRVRARLEGKTEDSKVLSVTDQVDHFIRHATSSTKLSLMYEGWTAWV